MHYQQQKKGLSDVTRECPFCLNRILNYQPPTPCVRGVTAYTVVDDSEVYAGTARTNKRLDATNKKASFLFITSLHLANQILILGLSIKGCSMSVLLK
jgi:hypothetical protein